MPALSKWTGAPTQACPEGVAWAKLDESKRADRHRAGRKPMTAIATTLAELDESQIRVDLTAALRLAAKLDLHEWVANHFSAAVSPDGTRFLMNPKWRH